MGNPVVEVIVTQTTDAVAVGQMIADLRNHIDKKFAELSASITQSINQGALMEKVDKLVAEVTQFVTLTQANNAARDAVDVQLRADLKAAQDALAAAQANDAADAATIKEFSDGVDAALAKADEALALITPPAPPVVEPPVDAGAGEPVPA